MAINKIIFLTLFPITALEVEKWHFNYLMSQGFEVEVFDLTELLNKKIRLQKSQLIVPGVCIRHISSYEELDTLIGRSSSNSIFIDYLVAHSDISLQVAKVFRLIKKNRARYTFISSGALPLPATYASGITVLKENLMKAILKPAKLFDFTASRWIRFLAKWDVLYPSPVVIFGGDSDKLRGYVERRALSKEIVVPINSFDYDSYIGYLRNQNNKVPEVENFCVFLDEAATHHPDYALLSISPAEPEKYYSAMNRYFDFIEKETGLKVVIAAHPRSSYEGTPNIFGGRAIVKGQTIDLVAKSKLAITHMSTSVSFAILFNKPITIVKIPGSTSRHSDLWVKTIAASIGCESVDLDSDAFTCPERSGKINQEKYLQYLNRYIKSTDAPELPTWEIVAKTIKNLG